MGALIVSQRIPVFIVTLAGLMVFKKLHWKVIHNATISITTGGTENLFSRLTTWYLPPLESWLLAGGAYAAFRPAVARTAATASHPVSKDARFCLPRCWSNA